MSRFRPGIAEIVTCTLTWGTIGSIVRQLDVPSTVIVFFRLILGFAVVVVYLAARGRLATARPGARRGLLVGVGLVFAAHWALLFEAYKRLGVVTTILIVFLGPVLWAFAAPFVLRERLRARVVVALLVAFGGIALISAPDIERIDGLGLAFALGSAVLFAVVVLMGKLLTEHYEPAALAVWQLGVAALVMTPALAGVRADAVMRAAPGLLLLGIVYSGVLQIAYFRAVRALDAQTFGVLFYLEPASAVFYAWLLLHESPAAATLAGGALVLGAGLAIILADRAVPSPVAGD